MIAQVTADSMGVLRMSPSFFAVRNEQLDRQLVAALLAGDFQRMQSLLAEKTLLLRATYGQALTLTAPARLQEGRR